MKTLTYDNPDTCCRECWQDGKMVCSYHMSLLLMSNPIPPELLFFGANIGPWESGQYFGDFDAMDKKKED